MIKKRFFYVFLLISLAGCGTTGGTGAQGETGETGLKGETGSNGLNSLISFREINNTSICLYNGMFVETGLDKNSNNILESSEILTTETFCFSSSTYEEKEFELSIIHVNDQHSHVVSDNMSLYIDDKKVKVDIGGYPRVVSKIKSLQNEKKNVLTLNAGDTFQGTIYYSVFKGDADVKMFNIVNWDALALGNHEFDEGDEFLANYLSKLNLDSLNILAANIFAPENNFLENSWSPYTIKEMNGQKVGIIGIDIVQKTQVSSSPSDEIEFYNEVTTAQKYIDELEGKGINKIILLTHVGLNNDKNYASQLSGVDIIIGGDSHSLMGDFSSVGLSSHDTNYPAKTTDKLGNKVCIAQAWQYNYVVGNLDVVFNNDGTVKSCEGTPTLLMGDNFSFDENEISLAKIEETIANNENLEIVEEESNTLAKLEEFKSQVEEKMSQVLGEASEFLGHNRIPMDAKDGKSYLPLGSDIAPIVAKSFYDLSNRADACIQNAGGVRIAVEEGNITMETAYTLLPFSNTLYEIDMYGNEIKQVLEDALNNYIDEGGSTGSFPSAYGLRYDIDANVHANSRISNLEIKDRITGTWSLIDNSKMYVIVTNNYIAGGKDGYTTFKTVQEQRGEGVDTYLDYAMSFVKYVENKTANGEKVSKLPKEDHPIKSFNKTLVKVGAYNTNKKGGSEIVSFCKDTKYMYTTNGADNALDIIDINDPKNPTLVKQVDLSPYGTGVNSVNAKNKVAVAVENGNDVVGKKQSKGKVVIFKANGDYDKNITVGYLPDMVTFNNDGTKIIVANEGEPNNDYSVDPIGSIGIIDVATGVYTDINFSNATLTSSNDGTEVRLGATPSNNKAQDFEPEYITVVGDYAYVTLQENNAMVKVDIANATIEYVKSYGVKSYETANTIDIEEEGEIKMKNYPSLFGLYMPDSIASYEVNGSIYLVTANEGDGREYINDDETFEFVDEAKIKKLTLDPSIEDAYKDENDLKVMVDLGDSNNDGVYEELYTYGARSFSIWNNDGDLVFDSGDEISKKVALYQPELFNQDEGEMDGRSGNKGAEPEALSVGKIDGKTYAFVGLERQNAIMVYDITTPSNAKFISYIITENEGDISAEGMKFIPATVSPNGKNLLLVSFEVSGSTVIYEIKL